MRELGLSERKTCELAGVGVNSIRHMRARGHAPKIETLFKLSEPLQIEPEALMEAAFTDFLEEHPDYVGRSRSIKEQAAPAGTDEILIMFAVEGGVWHSKKYHDLTQKYFLELPNDPRIPNVFRQGYFVKGDILNKLYRDGSIVITADLSALGRFPQTGDVVVVSLIRERDGDAQIQILAMRYELEMGGGHVFRPETDNPELCSPIYLPRDAASLQVSNNGQYRYFDGDLKYGGDDVVLSVHGIVTGSYRLEGANIPAR